MTASRYSWTVDDARKANACYSNRRLSNLWAGRKRLSPADIVALKGVTWTDKLWALQRMLPPAVIARAHLKMLRDYGKWELRCAVGLDERPELVRTPLLKMRNSKRKPCHPIRWPAEMFWLTDRVQGECLGEPGWHWTGERELCRRLVEEAER